MTHDWYVSKQVRGGAAVSAVLLVASLGLAACGSSGGGNANPYPRATGGTAAGGGSSATGVVTQAGQGARLDGQFPGTALVTFLPTSTPAWIPAGFSLVTGTGNSSGPDAIANDEYELTSMKCMDLEQYYGGPGFGEVAYAGDAASNAAGTQAYEWALYEFASASAATAFVQDYEQKFAACGQFSGTDSSGENLTVTFSLGPSSSAQVPDADEATDLHLKVSGGSHTIYGDMVAAADGNTVVLALTVAGSGAALPESPGPGAAAQHLLDEITAGEAAAPPPSAAGPAPSSYPSVSLAPLPSDTGGGQ